ncbi:MAG: hypothetical protein Q9159_000676 [Coniocarpon cinnabarinum]
MVKLEEVEDEAFVQRQPGDDGEWDTDDASGPDDDDAPLSESVTDRLAALADMVPPHTRLQLQKTASAASDWGWWGFSGLCKASWLITVSGLLMGIPFALAQVEDQQFALEEKQQQMQQGSNDVSTTRFPP